MSLSPRAFAKSRPPTAHRPAPLRAWPLAAITITAWCASPPALAQVASVSIAADTDDRFRGVSLSDGQPTLSVGVSYDAAGGAYGGLTARAGLTRRSRLDVLGYVAYVGYAGRLGPGASWDVGVTNSEVSLDIGRRYASNYTEIYAGISRTGLAAHIHYSPNYLTDSGTVYTDIDGAVRRGDHWRFFGHAGVLTALSDRGDPYAGRVRLDVKLGVAREFRHGELRLAWTSTTPTPIYPTGVRQGRDALILGATYYF